MLLVESQLKYKCSFQPRNNSVYDFRYLKKKLRHLQLLIILTVGNVKHAGYDKVSITQWGIPPFEDFTTHHKLNRSI